MHHDESFFAEPRSWVVVAFILFFILFGKRLWGAMASMLDSRAARVKYELEEASRLRREAEAMLRNAEKQHADAMTEAKALIANARVEAGRVAAAATAEAEGSAKRREKMAVDRIAAAEKAAVDDVRLAAADIATVAARQVLSQGLSVEADAHLIDQAITQLPAALGARRAA